MVYGRQIGGKVTTFGTSGYTYDNTFVLYDRSTESLWYPLEDGKFTAVSGSLQGQTIPYAKQPIVTLGKWRKKHPDTVVLLGDRADLEPTAKSAPAADRNPG